jgi:ribonuclease P protein component
MRMAKMLADDPPRAKPPKLHRLKRRAEFLRAASGKRIHAKAFSLQMAPSVTAAPAAGAHDQGTPPGPPRFGFTVTKKIGNAVVRNRIRRRLKEAVRTLEPLPARPGHDYVLIARIDALRAPFAALKGELVRALGRIESGKMKAAGSPRPSTGATRGAPGRSPGQDDGGGAT